MNCFKPSDAQRTKSTLWLDFVMGMVVLDLVEMISGSVLRRRIVFIMMRLMELVNVHIIFFLLPSSIKTAALSGGTVAILDMLIVNDLI